MQPHWIAKAKFSVNCATRILQTSRQLFVEKRIVEVGSKKPAKTAPSDNQRTQSLNRQLSANVASSVVSRSASALRGAFGVCRRR